MCGKKIKSRQLRTSFFLVSTLIIFAVGGATFAWQAFQKSSSSADSSSVVGQPSLPAASVDAIFARAHSPMAGTGAAVESAARQTNIDDAFALAVWWAETNDGMAGVGLTARNPGGVKGSANYPVTGGGYSVYPSYTAAVNDWFTIVKARYINAGRTSIYTICGPYVGTATACTSGGWAGKVSTYMQRYRAMAPARPTATTAPRTTPVPLMAKAPVHGALYLAPTAAAKAQPTAAQNGKAGKKTTTTTPAQTKPRTLLPIGEALGIGFALLLALALAAWGMLIRYGKALMPLRSGLEGEEDTAMYPAGLTSQLTSFSDSQPLPTFQPLTEQLNLTSQPQRVGHVAWQMPVDKIDTQMHEAIPPTSSGGLVNTEPNQRKLHLPTRAPVPLNVPGPGSGLLRRYRGEQSSEHPSGNQPENG